MSPAAGWVIVIASGLGCYALKFAGYAVPQRWFERPGLTRLVGLLPVALLAALIVVEAVADGRHYDWDAARLAGCAVGVFALWRRAPFLVVVLSAAVTAALLRLL